MKKLLTLVMLSVSVVGCGNAVTVASKEAVNSLTSDSKFTRGPDSPAAGDPALKQRDKIVCENISNSDFLVLNSKMQSDEPGRSMMMFKRGNQVRGVEISNASRDLVEFFYEDFSSSAAQKATLRFMHFDIFSNIADGKIIRSLPANDPNAEYVAGSMDKQLKKYAVSSNGEFLVLATEKGYGVRKVTAPDTEISFWENIPENYYSPRWDTASQVVYWDAFDAKTKKFYQAVSFLDGTNIKKTIPITGVALVDAHVLGVRFVNEQEIAWMEWTNNKVVLVQKNTETEVIKKMELSGVAYAPSFAVSGENLVLANDKALELVSLTDAKHSSRPLSIGIMDAIRKKRDAKQRVPAWGIEKLQDRNGEVFFSAPGEFSDNYLYKLTQEGFYQRIGQQACVQPKFFKEAY